jgi:hypothetical protein
MKKLSLNKSLENGSTFVEFAIGLPVLMLLIIMMMDASLYLLQRSMITNAAANLNRTLATGIGQVEADPAGLSLSGLPACAFLEIYAASVKERFAADNSLYFEGASFELTMKSQNLIPFRLITITGYKPFACLSCKFFPINLPPISHRSTLVVERPNFTGHCPDIATVLLRSNV